MPFSLGRRDDIRIWHGEWRRESSASALDEDVGEEVMARVLQARKPTVSGIFGG